MRGFHGAEGTPGSGEAVCSSEWMNGGPATYCFPLAAAALPLASVSTPVQWSHTQHSTAVRRNRTSRTKRQVSSPRTSATGQTQGQSSHGSVLAMTHVCCALQTRECLGPGLSAHSGFQQLERFRLPGAPGKRPLINRCHETREVLSDLLGQDRFSIVTKPAK